MTIIANLRKKRNGGLLLKEFVIIMLLVNLTGKSYLSGRNQYMKSYGYQYTLDHSVMIRPLEEISGFPVCPGMYDVNGASALPVGVNFTIHTHGGTSCELLLFHKGEEEPYAVLPFPETYKIGDVYSMIVFELDIEEFEYAYRVDGPYDPKKGLLFNRNNILLDPYAKAVTGQRFWGVTQDKRYHARVVKNVFDWGIVPQSKRELSDLIIYELHVRGFTQHESSGVTHRGTFAGLKEKIPYLKELGINAVELMPIFEFDENRGYREVDGRKLIDYWGYNSVGFFAPNSSYAASEEYNYEGTELRELIKELHDNGIEVILDVVFNHTAEGNEQGPIFSFKGLDNNIYYMLTPDGNYYNFSGCGNTLNCNHPVIRQLILECLRYWTVSYRMDGFRFDLASILGRNSDGSPSNNPPLLEMLACDPILRNVKLIAEAWDAGGMYQVGSFPAGRRWAEWNGRYRDAMRGFLKGENWKFREAAWSVCGSGDLYGGYHTDSHGEYNGYNSCINFLTCHDGFTMYDLYSYNDKHNWSNGWGNTDGSDNNLSWNCGFEGETGDPEVLKLRYRMIRNACAVLMCSRGTPMFLAGDEFGNTQYGNNNSYCQDNEISWLDWRMLEKNRELFAFFKYMIAFRKEHRVISKKLPNAVCGMEGLQVHDLNAEKVTLPEGARTFSVSYAGYDTQKNCDDLVYVSINTYWENVRITLPRLQGNLAWFLSVDTYGDENGCCCYPQGQEKMITYEYVLRPRTTAVFYARCMNGEKR